MLWNLSPFEYFVHRKRAFQNRRPLGQQTQAVHIRYICTTGQSEHVKKNKKTRLRRSKYPGSELHSNFMNKIAARMRYLMDVTCPFPSFKFPYFVSTFVRCLDEYLRYENSCYSFVFSFFFLKSCTKIEKATTEYDIK